MSEKILVFEREQEIRTLCHSTLTQKGYAVSTAATVNEALTCLKKEAYDLLITDIQGSGPKGLNFLTNIQGIQNELSSIIITGQQNIQYALQGLQQGAQGILLKPFTGQELSDCIEEALGKNRHSKENIRLKLLLPIFEMSHGCLHHENLLGILETASTVLKRELKSDSIAIFLHEDHTKELALKYHLGLPEEKEHLLAIAEWVSNHEEPLILVDSNSGDPFFQQIISNHNLSAAMGIPIRGKKGVVGIVILFREKEKYNLTQTDIELMTVILNQLAIAIDNIRLFDELEEAHFEAIKALADALEAKDAYTRGHSDRTVEYAVAIANRIGLSAHEVEHIKYAAILHDIGKIGISESILNKPGPLTEEEFEIMKTHPELGANIVKRIRFLAPVAPLIYHHQERYDGKGYPEGLSGEAIPIGSRIIAVLDAYDAMTSDRIYRKAPGKQRAVSELKQFSGTQFDPLVVHHFLSLLGEGDNNTPTMDPQKH